MIARIDSRIFLSALVLMAIGGQTSNAAKNSCIGQVDKPTEQRTNFVADKAGDLALLFSGHFKTADGLYTPLELETISLYRPAEENGEKKRETISSDFGCGNLHISLRNEGRSLKSELIYGHVRVDDKGYSCRLAEGDGLITFASKSKSSLENIVIECEDHDGTKNGNQIIIDRLIRLPIKRWFK